MEFANHNQFLGHIVHGVLIFKKFNSLTESIQSHLVTKIN